MKKAILQLENGQSFQGFSFGHDGESCGEIVFNTSMTGYQEILTDPSYKSQTVMLTYPEIGNYGIDQQDNESSKIHASGLIVKNYNEYRDYFNKGKLDIGQFLKSYEVPGIYGVDTRKITKIVRDEGNQRCIISSVDFDKESLLKKIKSGPEIQGVDLVEKVTTKEIYSYTEQGKYKVAVYDFGIKNAILENLAKRQCNLKVFPANTDWQEIVNYSPDGIFLSNGPGDPSVVDYAVKNVKNLIGKFPIFGICFGHQVLCQAYGYEIYKLKFGHRGGNQPVVNNTTSKIEITSQNHGFAVSSESEEKKFSHIHLNDHTISGFENKKDKVFSIQYHPEASPGPHDSWYLFDQFIDLMNK